MNFTEDLEHAFDIALDDPSYNDTSLFGDGYYIASIGSSIASCIGVISDFLIIFAILKNRRMKSRRNILLLYWAIFDAIDFGLFMDAIGAIVKFATEPEDSYFGVCLISFSNGLFKFNCVLLMVLLVSTTVMRLQFITDAKFQWAICISTILIYLANFLICYHVSQMIIFIKFAFMFFVLFVVVLVKEVNICYKLCRDDPVSAATQVKMNLVRIYTYNYVLVVLASYAALELFDAMPAALIVLEYSLHFTPLYMLVYLCIVDENFKSAFKNFCKKSSDTDDATVVYNTDGNKETVDFTRI